MKFLNPIEKEKREGTEATFKERAREAFSLAYERLSAVPHAFGMYLAKKHEARLSEPARQAELEEQVAELYLNYK